MTGIKLIIFNAALRQNCLRSFTRWVEYRPARAGSLRSSSIRKRSDRIRPAIGGRKAISMFSGPTAPAGVSSNSILRLEIVIKGKFPDRVNCEARILRGSRYTAPTDISNTKGETLYSIVRNAFFGNIFLRKGPPSQIGGRSGQNGFRRVV